MSLFRSRKFYPVFLCFCLMFFSILWTVIRLISVYNQDIKETDKEDILLIPLEAVKQDKEGNFVLLSQGRDKRALKRRIKLGISDGSNVEVTSGLRAADTIIIETKTYLPAEDQNSGRNPFMPFGRRRR